MEYVDIKIQLPSTITVKIPAFSDIPMEGVFEVIMKDGVKRIKETITERAIEAFIRQNEKAIGRVVKRLVAEKEKEIRRILELK